MCTLPLWHKESPRKTWWSRSTGWTMAYAVARWETHPQRLCSHTLFLGTAKFQKWLRCQSDILQSVFIFSRTAQRILRNQLWKNTWLPNPKVNNMKKKQMDQKGAPGIFDMPSGYAIKARPGPAKETMLHVWATKESCLSRWAILGSRKKPWPLLCKERLGFTVVPVMHRSLSLSLSRRLHWGNAADHCLWPRSHRTRRCSQMLLAKNEHIVSNRSVHTALPATSQDLPANLHANLLARPVWTGPKVTHWRQPSLLQKLTFWGLKILYFNF